MSAEQFRGWASYASIEPFGEERADLRQALTTAAIVNVNRDPKRGRPAQVEDFMPFKRQVKRRSSGEYRPLDRDGFARLKGQLVASLETG